MNIEKLSKLDLKKCSKLELITQVHSLVDLVNTLIDQVEHLKQEAVELKAHKNSSNSSTPPSHDYGRVKKNQSLRKKSGLKPGAQI